MVVQISISINSNEWKYLYFTFILFNASRKVKLEARYKNKMYFI